jgi:UDP-glucose 4-epimerase
MSLKKVIISGANGYFGAIATKYFAASNEWEVLRATRTEDGDIYFNIDNPDELSNKKMEEKVDLLIHAAAANDLVCSQDPYLCQTRNVIGTKAALDFCVLNRIEKFVYLSTSHVFGNLTGVINEDSIPYPVNDYGLSHLQAEEQVRMYERNRSIQSLIIRPSNFFGVPNNIMEHRNWLPASLSFCKNAVTKGEIQLLTPGYQKRNFVSINDICQVIYYGIEQMNQFPLVHVSGPNTFRIRDLAYQVQQVMKNKFNKNIEVIIPDGNVFEDNFSFESKYINNIYTPKDRINDFIEQLCRILLKSKDGE